MEKLNESKSPILPMGLTNLNTGENKVLNIYEDFRDDYINIFKADNGKFVGIISSGKGNQKPGDMETFIHDQNHYMLGRWKFVEELEVGKNKDLLAKKYKKINTYVYK